MDDVWKPHFWLELFGEYSEVFEVKINVFTYMVG